MNQALRRAACDGHFTASRQTAHVGLGGHVAGFAASAVSSSDT